MVGCIVHFIFGTARVRYFIYFCVLFLRRALRIATRHPFTTMRVIVSLPSSLTFLLLLRHQCCGVNVYRMAYLLLYLCSALLSTIPPQTLLF